jgi:DNA-binding NarL/FixJ family response regulator
VPKSVIRVLLVDDQEIVRSGVQTMIETDPGIEVVGDAADGAAAVSAARTLSPDVVLMDLSMPGGVDGATATRRLLESPNPPQVLILTTFDADDKVISALDAGAVGFLLKGAGRDQLIAAIRSAYHGDSVLAPAVMRQMTATFTRSTSRRESEARLAVGKLNEKEQATLRLIALGKTNNEIATELWVSVSTAKSYVSRVLSRLDFQNRTQAAQLAYDAGLHRRGDDN